jgi:hypothetical protein
MISVLINAGGDAKALARLLTALVPAAAEGLVREVAVLGGDEVSRAVADDAGADLYPAGAWRDAVEKARGPWLAGFPLGPNFAPDWMEQLAAHLAGDGTQAARLVARGGGLALSAAPEGWLAPKRAASAVAVEQDLQRLARRGGGRLRILDWR